MSGFPNSLILRENEFAFYIEPEYSSPPSHPIPIMTITRPEGIIKLNEPVPTSHFISEISIKGLLGIINLHAGPYVIVVTESDFIGEIMEKPIFRMLHVKILPCHTQANLSSAFLQDELIFLGLLEKYLNNHAFSGLYYSRGYDLCSRLQLHFNSPSGNAIHPRSSMENQFVANRKVLGNLFKLIQNDDQTFASHFVLPCIQGFVGIFEDILIGANGERISLALISRRSSSRVGARFHSRGIDEEGNVSNFVETEQILMYQKSFQSFTQVRGSIPVFWKQNTNLKYKPPIELGTTDKSAVVFRQHFNELKKEFGEPVVAVNLVDTYGFEGKLAANFTKNARATEDFLRYIHFDSCAGTRSRRSSNQVRIPKPDDFFRH
jgi:phosphatidylinositol 4-phosphatase